MPAEQLQLEKPTFVHVFYEFVFSKDNNNLEDIKIVQMDDSIEEEK